MYGGFFRKLLEEYEEDPHKLTKLDKSPITEVQSLLTRLQTRVKVRKATLVKEVRRLKKSYKAALTKRIKELTQADKLEEAIAFNNELKLLDTKPEVKEPEVVVVKEEKTKPVVSKEPSNTFVGSWHFRDGNHVREFSNSGAVTLYYKGKVYWKQTYVVIKGQAHIKGKFPEVFTGKSSDWKKK